MSARGRSRFPVLGVVLVAGIAAVACGVLYVALRPDPVVRVTLRVHPLLGSEPLALGASRYPNPGGAGTFTIRDFQFFVSNVRLASDDGDFREAKSYHLARFDDEDGVFRIELGEVPRRAYDRVEFGIGVDSAANNSIEALGDLDPNGRMAWGWEIGYKFVLVEGGLELADGLVPLVYHVGFDENYALRSVPLDASSFDGDAATIELCADLLALFTGVETVDMGELPSVTFDGDDSRLLARNWAGMVTACPAETRLATR
jgi:hypothetical protein